jgi:hypothetical protein
MLRRWIRQIGFVTIAQAAWRHRGTVVRAVDLARHTPQRVRCRETDDLVTEARALAALDRAVPTDTSIRITGIADGSVTLEGRADQLELETARSALLRIPKVADVQTDAAGSPSTDDVLANALP